VSEFNSNDAKGGGIGSGVAVIYNQISHLLGFDLVHDAVFGVDKKKPQSLESQFAAYLVDKTYDDIDKRPATVLNRFVRVPAYDTEHVSVWKNNKTGEYTVTVRGSRAEAGDIKEDLGIAVGNTNPNSSELDGVLDRLEAANPNAKYDIACHSLGASFVNKEQAEHGQHWDDVYIFNPGSSPMQNDAYEQAMANNDQYQYYVNHGDPISANLVHFMSQDTVQNSTWFGDYQYSPIGSHSITQWYPQGFNNQDGKPLTHSNETWLTPYEYKPNPDETWLTPYEYKEDAPKDPETSYETGELRQDTKTSREANLS
jgi:hypothetical protein